MNSPLFTSMSAELAKKNKFIIDLQWSLNSQLRGYDSFTQSDLAQLIGFILSAFQKNVDLYDHDELLAYYASLSPQHSELVELVVSRNPIGTRLWHTLENVLFEPLRSLCPLDVTDFKRLYCELYKRVALYEGKSNPKNTNITSELESLIFHTLGDTKGKSIYAPYGVSVNLLLGDYSEVFLETSDYLQALQDFLALGIEGEVTQLSYLDPNSNRCDTELLVSIPPVGRKSRVEFKGKKNLRSETIALEKAFDAVSDGRVENAVVTCSQSLLFASDIHSVELRKRLIEAGVVSSVTLLPPNMWSATSLQLVLIHLRKRRFEVSDPSLDFTSIRFINATDFVEDRVLQVSSLLSSYEADPIKNISVDHVFGSEDEMFDMNVQRLTAYVEPVVVPDGYTMRELAGLAECARVRASVDFGKLVKVSDFPRDGRPSAFNDVDSVELPKSKPVEVDRDALLISSIENSGIKVNAFKYEGSPIYISSSVIALYLEESKVSARWLALAMRSSRIQQLLSSQAVGAAMSRIKWSILQNIEFAVPTLEVQVVEVSKLEREFDKERAKEVGLDKYVEKSRQAYLDALSVAKHNLVDSLAVVKPKVKVLMKTLENRGELVADDEIGRHGQTVKEYLASVHQGLLSLGNLVKDLGSHELMRGEGNVNLIKCLDALTQELSSDRVSITLGWNVASGYLGSEVVGAAEAENRSQILYKLIEDKEIYVGLSDVNLRIVINQIIQNTLSHNKSASHLNVLICVSLTVDGGLRLMCANDGGSFPKGLTLSRFTTKGETLGKSGNTGTGGYIINDAMRMVKGGVRIHHLDLLRSEGIEECDEGDEVLMTAQGFAHAYEEMNACVELIFPNLEL